MNQNYGFFTVATGDEHYYYIAANLLYSYHKTTNRPLPFAILADRENEYTRMFDKTILLKEPTNSYLDKLALYDNLPFDENIFIDADCLAYDNLNVIFEHFKDADDFCCYGRVLPIEDKTGWFDYKDLGELQSKVNYCVGLHGGIYYIRRSSTAKNVFETAKQIAANYSQYNFKGKFATPGDEPIIALSMALNGCRPIPFHDDGICCYWEHEGKMKLDIATGKALIFPDERHTHLVHWGTRFTRELLYQREVATLMLSENGAKRCLSNSIYNVKILMEKTKKFAFRAKNKLRRMIRVQR